MIQFRENISGGIGMKKIQGLCVAFFLVWWLWGCAPGIVQNHHSPLQCRCIMNIVDVDGIPVDKATVDYAVNEGGTQIKAATVTTDGRGLFQESFSSATDAVRLRFRISKDEYYEKAGVISFPSEDASDGTVTKHVEVTLSRPSDYLDANFGAYFAGSMFGRKILEFVDTIVRDNPVPETYAATRSIALVSFENRDYLRVAFASGLVYNDLFYDGPQIAGKLFHAVVTPALERLIAHFDAKDGFYGYEVTVIGYTSCLCDRNGPITEIEYRFFIPETAARHYCNKDISAQRLLGSSVVLMNDKKITSDLQQTKRETAEMRPIS